MPLSQRLEGGAHLIEFVELKLGFSLVRAGWPPVEHLGVAVAKEVAGDDRYEGERQWDAHNHAQKVGACHRALSRPRGRGTRLDSRPAVARRSAGALALR